MSLPIQNWQAQIENMTNDPNVSIRYVKISEVDGYGFFVSIIPPGEANTGHYHPEFSEKYHISQGQGILLSLPANQLQTGTQPVRQHVRAGMSIDIPAPIIHRLVNNGQEPLIFFFECPMSHMAAENPVRTIVEDFGGPLKDLVTS